MLLNSEQFFRIRLQPASQRARYHRLKLTYNLLTDGVGNAIGDEYQVRGIKLKHPMGFEPFFLRKADNDDPDRIMEFLLKVAEGKLPPAAYQYMLSVATQNDIKAGRRPGIPAFMRGEYKQTSVTDEFGKEFEKQLAIDTDVKRVAQKFSHDPEKEKRILAERPHLLEDKK